MANEGFEVTEWGSYRVLQMDSERIDECIDYYRKAELDGILISPHQGYVKQEIGFLQKYPDISGVILPYSKDCDISALSFLHDLKFLSISGNTQAIKLSVFPLLEEAWVEWHSKMELSASCNALRTLSLRRYRPKQKNLEELPDFSRLINLSIVQSPISSLDGIGRYQSLQTLELSYLPKLKELGALRDLQGAYLETLDCEKCPVIMDYESIRDVSSLKCVKFNWCSDIPSISFMSGLRVLKDFRFVGTDVKDGIMDSLLNCPQLLSVGFTDKRHFSHTGDEINSILSRIRTNE